jgi:hypothetical protein
MNLKGDDFEASKELINQLDNFIEMNQEKIEKLTNYMDFTQYVSYFSFITFLTILAFKVSLNFSWFFLLAPAMLTVICSAAYLNLFLKLKDLYDEFEKRENNVNIGSVLSYFCLNTGAICLCTYLVLATLKATAIIGIDWNMIAVPIYVLLGIGFFYLVFITPAFISNSYYFDVILIYTYVIASMIFLTLINMKLDKEIGSSFIHLFIPIIYALFLHICHAVLGLVRNKELNSMREKVVYLVSIVLILFASILTPLRLDGTIGVPGWVCVSMCLFAFVFGIYDKIVKLFVKEEEEEN